MNRNNLGIILLPLLFLLLTIILFLPYTTCGRMKITNNKIENFQECNCSDLNNKITKLEGDVLNYQQRSQESNSKCEDDKSKLQNQNSQERTKMVQESAKKDQDLIKTEERARALTLDLEKCETSRRAIVAENEKLREDYKITLQALTNMTENAQSCQISLDKTTKAFVNATSDFAQINKDFTQSADYFNQLSGKHTALYQDCYNKSFYGWSGVQNVSTYSERDRLVAEKDKQFNVNPPQKVSRMSLDNNELLMSSANGKYKIYQKMTRDDINKMIMEILDDNGIIKIEKDKLTTILKSLSPIEVK